MGLLGNLINKAGEKLGSTKLGQTALKVLDVVSKPAQIVGVAVSNPVTLVTQGYGAAKQKVLNESIEKSIGKVAINTAVVGAAVLTGGTSAGRTAATQLGKSLIPTTPKGIITTAIAAPVAIGILSETKKPLSAITKAPSELATFGKGIGKVIESPSASSVSELVKESPLLTAGAGLLLTGGAIKTAVGVGNIISNVQTKQAIQDLKTDQLPIAPVTPVADTSKALKSEQTPFLPATAVTAATAPLPTTNAKGKVTKRKAKKQIPQNISQRVNVVVQNKNSSVGIKQSKNYLKRSILA